MKKVLFSLAMAAVSFGAFAKNTPITHVKPKIDDCTVSGSTMTSSGPVTITATTSNCIAAVHDLADGLRAARKI